MYPEEHRREACKFFILFARFECALKASGFLKRPDGRADPNWDCFARVISDSFDRCQNQEVSEARAYMKSQPPRKQIAKSGRLDWSVECPDTSLDVVQLLKYVRRVRTNLFHGGKFQGANPDRQRDSELIQHSNSATLQGHCPR